MQMNEPPMSWHRVLSVSLLWGNERCVKSGQVASQQDEGKGLNDQEFEAKKNWKRDVALYGETYRSWTLEEIVGASKELRHALANLQNLVQMNRTILITGERGVGKEVVARSLQEALRRSPQAFVRVNCASIPPSMIATELFGQLDGGNSRRTQSRPRRFRLAAGATILLDGVGNLSSSAQLALLRALQKLDWMLEEESDEVADSIRVIALTERDLYAAAAAGTFNRDLFARLNGFPIRIPPLCERKEDIPMLVQSFLDRYVYIAGKRKESISSDAVELLQSYPWVGNLRALEHVLERFVILREMGFCFVDAMSTRQNSITARTWVRGIGAEQEVEDYELVETVLIEAIATFSD